MSRLKFTAIAIIVSIFATMLACSAVSQFDPQQAQSEPTAIGKKSRANNTQAEGGAVVEADCKKFIDGEKRFLVKTQTTEKINRVKVGATGYGAPPKRYYPEGQSRIMTMRASKVDAYRALAEVVGGLHIWGGSSIGDMVLEHDRYKAFIDTYVRGAHVIAVNPMEDGTYKTVVEMDVDERFLSQVMAFIDPATKSCFEKEGIDLDKVYYSQNGARPNFYYSE